MQAQVYLHAQLKETFLQPASTWPASSRRASVVSLFFKRETDGIGCELLCYVKTRSVHLTVDMMCDGPESYYGVRCSERSLREQDCCARWLVRHGRWQIRRVLASTKKYLPHTCATYCHVLFVTDTKKKIYSN